MKKLRVEVVPRLVGAVELHQSTAVAVHCNDSALGIAQPDQFRPARIDRHPFAGKLLLQFFEIFGGHGNLVEKSGFCSFQEKGNASSRNVARLSEGGNPVISPSFV